MDYEEVRRRARIGLFHTIIPLSRYIWHTNYFDTISFGLAEGGHGQQLIQLIEEYGHIDKKYLHAWDKPWDKLHETVCMAASYGYDQTNMWIKSISFGTNYVKLICMV